jgi:hypothetical protein
MAADGRDEPRARAEFRAASRAQPWLALARRFRGTKGPPAAWAIRANAYLDIIPVRRSNLQYFCARWAARDTRNRSEPMSHSCALFSIIFMISFVALFDRRHLDGLNARFCKDGLLSSGDIQRLQSILSACRE